MTTISAVQFPGYLSTTETSLTPAHTLTDSSFVITDDYTMYNSTINRSGTVTVNSNIEYYIQVTGNLNSAIGYVSDPQTDQNVLDDVWTLNRLYASINPVGTIGSTFDVSSIEYNLPQISNVRVPIMDIEMRISNDFSGNSYVEWKWKDDTDYNTVTDTSGSSGSLIGKIFDLDILFNSDASGVITAETQYYDASGSGITVRIPETLDYAQLLSVGYGTSLVREDVTTTSSDRLVVGTSASIMNAITGTDVKAKRDAVDALYTDKNILREWTIQIDAQDASSSTINNITNYARLNDWTASNYGFETGTRIVASTSDNLSISMTGMDNIDGNSTNGSVTLISSTTIYGILRQN